MKILILLLAPLLIFSDIAIEPYAASYHFDRDKDYNEDHKYIGLVYRYDQYEIGVSTFKNSHYKRTNSFYAGYRQPVYEYNDVEFGIWGDIGYQTGYNRKLLIYGGLYGEYENIYIKLAGNSKFIGATVGYVFKGLW